MGFPAFAGNPIYIFHTPHPRPFDRGVCFFSEIYAAQRIHAPFIPRFSTDGVSEIWGAPHTARKDGIRQSNFVICPYGHILHSSKQLFYIKKSCRATSATHISTLFETFTKIVYHPQPPPGPPPKPPKPPPGRPFCVTPNAVPMEFNVAL